MKENKQLVILGNGFDIAHGLKTSFTDFSKSLPVSLKTRWRYLLEQENINHDTWYDFENNINEITMAWFHLYFNEVISNNPSEKYLLDKINNINIVFEEICHHLFEYIKNENSRKIRTIPNIEKILNSDNSLEVINFNYTNTFMKYSNNKIYYIHGSINENFIVLGYPLRPEHHGIPNEATQYKKEKLREKLDFHRFLVHKKIPIKQIKFYLRHFDQQVNRMYSLIGNYNYKSQQKIISHAIKKTDNSIHKRWLKQMLPLLQEYSESNRFLPHNIWININLKSIKTIIILGHSLSSDIEIFEHIFEHASNLEKIILFVYNGEDFSKKVKLLNTMSSCTVHVTKYF